MTSEVPVFNKVIHAPQRLRVCAMLSGAQKVEFRLPEDHLGLSKPALSKHLTLLVEAGYVSQDRALRNSCNRLCLSPTPEGARAYPAHVQALRKIVATHDT